MTPDVEPVNAEPYRLRIGSYGVLHPLGSGGMSSVYRAVHLESGHEVALKVLPPYMARNPTVLKRFMGEAKSAESLEHRNIVSIYDHGSDQGRHYLVLEYVQGGDFHEYVQRAGPMAPGPAIDVVLQVVEGLEYAASRGLIHRDVKPSNLMRTPDGDVKITDLGLALRSGAEDERVTREGTTVGTVDYMAPEQARDSRATSFQSDIYSLGCTFYYLLTALPPYPGGDIADKLTRHVRDPAPDVRDVRPEISQALAAVLTRMMAKHPEDRYDSYAELRSALLSAGRVVSGNESSIALVPIDDDALEPTRAPSVRGFGAPDPRDSSVAEISLAALAPLHLDAPSTNGASALGPPSPYGSLLQRLGADETRSSADPVGVGVGARLVAREPSLSATAWVVRCAVTGLFSIVVIIGLDLLIRGPIPTPSPPVVGFEPLPEPVDASDPVATRLLLPPPPVIDIRPAAIAKEPPALTVVDTWQEPIDAPPVAPLLPRYTPDTLVKYLPAWARAPIVEQIDGPTTRVQRAPETRGDGIVRSLRQALDVTKGTVEIGDDGPFTIDDFRVPGDPRLIRATPGRRPVVRIDGPTLDAVRKQPGAVTLSNKSLTLDSIDLVVNVRDLSLTQRSLFHCEGAQLTLRNCTFTIVNLTHTPFTFLRADDPGGRPSRIRIEKCLIRGDVASLFELRRGPVELMVERSILASEGPIVKTPSVPNPAEHRLHLLGNVLGCRGPCIDLGGEGRSDPPSKRMVVRAFDNAFGRFQGPGTASLTSSENPAALLSASLDWLGDNNQFLGWRGYFAVGPMQMIRTRNLPAFRSTWSAAERQSQEVFVEWRLPATVADLTTADLALYLPGREASLQAVARPRPFLLAKTLLSFPAPSMPTARPWSPVPALATKPATGDAKATAPNTDVQELVFDADSAEWNGDLGAFLRDRASAPARHLRVRARGAGLRRCTPVLLPNGMRLELEIEKPSDPEAPWLVLVPAEKVSGRSLIELHGGSLSLSQVRIQTDDDCGLESLLRVEDGFLMLESCELTGPQPAGPSTNRLITFQAATTRPRSADTELFTTPWDRPVCLLSDCILITGGTAIEAEVGQGFVGLSNCAVAARGDVVALAPSLVARHRFNADLRFDRCTIAAGAAVVRAAAWPGGEPGPDRPWLISGSNTAYLDLLNRESVLLRADAHAIAQGQVFWQQNNDAVEVVAFVETAGAPLPNRGRDIVTKWINLWGSNHIRGVTGPRPNSPYPSVRFLERSRSFPIAPDDLVLDPSHFPGRPSLNVGAMPGLLSGRPRSPSARRR